MQKIPVAYDLFDRKQQGSYTIYYSKYGYDSDGTRPRPKS